MATWMIQFTTAEIMLVIVSYSGHLHAYNY